MDARVSLVVETVNCAFHLSSKSNAWPLHCFLTKPSSLVAAASQLSSNPSLPRRLRPPFVNPCVRPRPHMFVHAPPRKRSHTTTERKGSSSSGPINEVQLQVSAVTWREAEQRADARLWLTLPRRYVSTVPERLPFAAQGVCPWIRFQEEANNRMRGSRGAESALVCCARPEHCPK